MKIMLDKSPKTLNELSDQYCYDFWQFRTPLTKYKLSGRPYGLDNGCFTKFKPKIWWRMVDEATSIRAPLFICLPDVVGNAEATLELFNLFIPITTDLPRAFVLQDGIKTNRIPFEYIDYVFVGGTDAFKDSQQALNMCEIAKKEGKKVHVGRVNTYERASLWAPIADTCDGSGMSRYSHMLENVLRAIGK